VTLNLAETSVAKSRPSVPYGSNLFQTISEKPMQLGSPNLKYESCMMSPGNPFILGSKVTSHKQCRRGSMDSCELWLLPVQNLTLCAIALSARSRR